MHYDSSIPVAVFLGPSLKKTHAETILKANYYPPIRMGDIYRLLSTNVQVIIIIDGFFHAHIPVWQREILAALKKQIAVVGAASMGALRAAELAPYGMTGIGKIYHWYQQEHIEGDDEVALLHLDTKHDYYPISEPLVNLRYTLDNACLADIITASQSAAIQRELKQMYYGDRTYASICTGYTWQCLPPDTQKELQRFIDTHTNNIKQLDALEALHYCSQHEFKPIPISQATLKPGIDIERPIETYHRGVLSEQGQLFQLQDLLSLIKQSNTKKQAIITEASRRFFLLQWFKCKRLQMPEKALHTYKNNYYQEHDITHIDHWLSSNGLIQAELEQELADRATADWMLKQQWPELASSPLEKWNYPNNANSTVVHKLRASAMINDWAQHSGIEIPNSVLERVTPEHQHNFQQQFTDQDISQTVIQQLFELDFRAQKIIEKTPFFFGFDLWSHDLALIRELQMRGEISTLAQHRHQQAVYA